MARRRSASTRENVAPRGLYHRFRVVLRPRAGEVGESVTLEVPARTQGAARRVALQEHPALVVATVERIEE